ncbi:hypothetical protein AMELA_G00027030 [Ameiurus melas]|uniref:non-specific serine/threonine protein kinase n=1 Tax=Ameiurus melas TaxID=219545 RepID=A0A7J6BFR6_AMEME|nr:hypothetical protein AMELA_G00027030 [Ameiurus melas]
MQYCETITRPAPGRIKRSFVKWLICLTCCKKGQKNKSLCGCYSFASCIKSKPLMQMLILTQSSTQHYPALKWSTSFRAQNSWTSDKIIAPQSPEVERTDPEVVFASRYTTGELLRMGSFESVYADICLDDEKEVAIKTMDKNIVTNILIIPRERHEPPLEVALMEKVSKPPCCSNVVELLDWF